MIFLDGDYLGALAAARHLGEIGVPCFLVSTGAKSIMSCSKYISPLVCEDWAPEALCEFLIGLPPSFDGSVLYPASDDSSYFLGRYGAKLRSRFRLAFPDEKVIMALLDKEKLYTSCAEWQIPYPETTFPGSAAAVAGWQGAMPALLKPKTQIYINVQKKGVIVSQRADLSSSYDRYLGQLSYHHDLAGQYPTLRQPMIQRFHKEAQTDTISVSGYYHPNQPKPILLYTKKVLQKPKNIGIGLCFKAVPAVPQLAERVERICRETGYFGVFEAEFIHLAQDDSYLLMDFNPRLYSQVQFDILRGSLLPEFYYYQALEDTAKLSALYDGHEASLTAAKKDRYSSYWYLRFTYLTQVIAGKVSLAEMRKVLEEYRLGHPQGVDASYAENDPKPYYFDQWRSYRNFLKHPRDTYRKFFQDVG